MRHKLLVLLAVVMVALTPLMFRGRASTAQSGTTFDSPILTPPAQPTPTPSGPSVEAQEALRYISKREGIPTPVAAILNEALADARLAGLGRKEIEAYIKSRIDTLWPRNK